MQISEILTHSYVWHDSFICVTWPIHMCVHHLGNVHDSFICMTWPIHTCDMTYSYAWHDPFICVTWPIHMRDMTHSYVWHDPSICVPYLTLICDMTHSYERVVSHSSMSNVAHMRHTQRWVVFPYCHTHECVTSHLCYTHKWVSSWVSIITHFYMIYTCDVTHTSNSIHMSRTWMSHITYLSHT